MRLKFKMLCALLISGSAVLSALGFEFAKDGKAQCVIAVPEKITPLEQIAIDDLSGILQKITGAKFPVVKENEAGSPAIYLGFTDYAAKNGVDRQALGKEEWVIKSVDKNLILSGGGRIGPYYAVQALLRKAGYYMLTMEQEVIPEKSSLSIANPDEQKKPAFAGRYIFDNYPHVAFFDGITQQAAKDYNMYLLRNMLNGPGQSACSLRPYYIGDAYNIFQSPEYHSLMRYVPPEKYFKTHPEYYSMDENGKRIKPRTISAGGSLCMSNPEVAKVAAENMLQAICEDRKIIPQENWPTLYDISLLDNFPYICRCPDCKKIVAQYGGERTGGSAALMLLFSNKVAEIVGKEFPDVTIRIFGYASSAYACKGIKAVPNILVQFCDLFSSCDSYRPLTHKYNRAALNALKRWHSTGARLMVWDYWNMASGKPSPDTVIDTIQPDLKTFRRHNVSALFIEAERNHYRPQSFVDLQYFIGAQLMADPEQEVEKLIDIYINGYYGPAAKVMKEYLNELRQGVKAHPALQISIRVERWKYLTPEFVVKWYQKLTAAEKSLPEKSPYRDRVRADKISLMWFVCMAQSAYKEAFAQASISMDALQKECYEASKSYLYRQKFPKTKRHQKRLDDEWELATLKIPAPELFKNVPEVRIHIVGYPFYRRVASHNTSTEPDKEAACGKALRSAHKNAAHHGAGKMFRDGNMYCATAFYLSNIGSPGKTELKLDKVPQDEKYHWYRIPGNFNMNSLAYFWGHGWGIQMDISQFYITADGVSDTNMWNGWFRAKFTGPAYVPGSKQPNAIWIDLVVLTRPGEKSLQNLPSSGLVK